MLIFESPKRPRQTAGQLLTFTSNRFFDGEPRKFCDENMTEQSPFMPFSNGSHRAQHFHPMLAMDSGHHVPYSASPSSRSTGLNTQACHSHSNPESAESWKEELEAPQSAPAAPSYARQESFDYFQPSVSTQASFTSFQDSYGGNAPMPLRHNLWQHPLHRAPHLIPPHPATDRPLWTPTNSVEKPGFPENYSSGSRLPMPWAPEPRNLLEPTSASSGNLICRQTSSNLSDSSSEAGSISSPGASPAIFSGHDPRFSFTANRMVGPHHAVLHRAKSSPMAFGRDNDMPGQACAVCGDHAACQHYGVRTCEGCKGFFKRTVQKGAKYVCLGNKDCPVDKKRRNRCQFCRFQKCIGVGMVKEVVRTDSLKGRRGRLPSKPKNLGDREPGTRSSSVQQNSPQSGHADLIANLIAAHQESSPQVFLEHHEAHDGSSQTQNLDDIYQLMNDLTNSLIEPLKTWMEKIPGFKSDISAQDADVLVHAAAPELLTVRLAYRLAFEPEAASRVRLCNGATYSKSFLQKLLGFWVTELEELANALRNCGIDTAMFSTLCALLILQERPFLSDRTTVQRFQTKILESFREYTLNSQTAQNWEQTLAVRLYEIQVIAKHLVQQLRVLRAQFAHIRFPENLSRLLDSADR